MNQPNPVAVARGRLAIHVRRHPDDIVGLAERRRDLAAIKWERHVERLVAEAPELTPAQAGRIAALLSRVST